MAEFKIGEYALAKIGCGENIIFLRCEIVGVEETSIDKPTYIIKILNYRHYGLDKPFVSGVLEEHLMKRPDALLSVPPEKIIYNDPATVVFWEDGTKTVVKRAKGEKFNKYNAFCAALAKKTYGNNSVVNRIVQSGLEQKKVQKGRKTTCKSK